MVAARVCVLTEPDAVVKRTGQPLETPEDLAVWAPTAAAWVEAVAVLTPKQLNDCLLTLGDQLESTQYRQLGETMSRWSWWKIEPENLPTYATSFDIMTSRMTVNALYMPSTANDLSL